MIDVQAFDCDYLVCSGYKIFSPHMGFLYGRREVLDKLPTFREDFIPDVPPGKIEAGTFIYENVAGMNAAVAYIEELGARLAKSGKSKTPADRRSNIVHAMAEIRAYEQTLSLELLGILHECGATVYGVSQKERVNERVPTISFNLKNVLPAAVAEASARAGIGIRDGHMYSPRLMKRLGVNPETGIVRTSLVHYNTSEELHRFGNVLKGLIRHE